MAEPEPPPDLLARARARMTAGPSVIASPEQRQALANSVQEQAARAKEARDKLLADHHREQRAALARRAGGNPFRPTTETAAAAVQAEATAAARMAFPLKAAESAGAALPASVQAAAGVRISNDRILKGDVKAVDRRTNVAEWYRRIRMAATPHRVGDPWLATLLQFAAAVVRVEVRDRLGFAQRTQEQFATAAGLCAKTIGRCVRWCQAHGQVGVLNVLRRTLAGDFRYDANIYVPSVDVGAAPLPADVEGDDPVELPSASGALGVKARLATLFRLVGRPGGMNTTGLRAPPQDDPAPA